MHKTAAQRRSSVIFSGAALFMLSCCSPDEKIVTRATSPDGVVDAIIALRETDATVATPTEVYIEGKGNGLLHSPVFRADNVANIRVHWNGADSLVISASSARVFLQKNFITIDIAGKRRAIRIALDITQMTEPE